MSVQALHAELGSGSIPRVRPPQRSDEAKSCGTAARTSPARPLATWCAVLHGPSVPPTTALATTGEHGEAARALPAAFDIGSGLQRGHISDKVNTEPLTWRLRGVMALVDGACGDEK
jgi:hypothetical protein